MKFFILSSFDKHDKTQLLAKFQQILYMGFRATLNFRKLKVANERRYGAFEPNTTWNKIWSDRDLNSGSPNHTAMLPPRKQPIQLYLILRVGHNSPLSHGGHIVPGDQKSFVLPR